MCPIVGLGTLQKRKLLSSLLMRSQILRCPVCNRVTNTISATLTLAVLSINQFSYSTKITKIMQHRDMTCYSAMTGLRWIFRRKVVMRRVE